jgi:hypothetical protein
MRRIIFGGLLLIAVIGGTLYPRRQAPPWRDDYAVPRTVGAWSQVNDMTLAPEPWWPLTTGRPFHETLSLFRQEHDLSAIGFGLRAHPTINQFENIRHAFRSRDVDIMVLWLSHWIATEPDCRDGKYVAWQAYPEAIFEELYVNYSDVPLTIILMSFESDVRLWGKYCWSREECPPHPWYTGECIESCEDGTLVAYDVTPEDATCQQVCADMAKMDRAAYMLRVFNARQRAAMNARFKYRHAKLKVYHAIEIDQYDPGRWLLVARDIIPMMQSPPDFIGLSLWPAKSDPALESFHNVQLWTGLPAHRFFIAEVGALEVNPGDQYNRIMSVVPPLFDEGIAFALVWSLEQWQENQQTLHAIVDPATGEYRSGMQAIRELNEEYGHD